MLRYIAFVWTPGTPAQAEAESLCVRALREGPQWREVFSTCGLRLFCIDATRKSAECYHLAGRSGAVLGVLFGRPQHGDGECSEITRGFSLYQSARIVASEGGELARSYWGRYVAFLADAGSRKYVVKSPRGGVPCFKTMSKGVHVYFSSIQDCLDLGIQQFSINWDHLRARVAVGAFHSNETALCEVTEVHAGERVCIDGQRETRRFLWNPSEIASERILEDSELAARELRSTAKACVHAWASRHESLLHRLSGGLDSSIVLGCLRDTPSRPHITCISYFHELMQHSDERKYARQAAIAAGVDLVEHRREAAAIDFRALLRLAPTPNPAPHLAHLESNVPERALARDREATAVFSGDAGDPLFYRHGKDLAITDLVRRRGLTSEAVRLSANVAPLIYRSVWSLLWSAVRDAHATRVLDSSTGITCPRHLVTRSTREEVLREARFVHPWFQPDPDIPPGKQLHIRLALFAEEIFYAPFAQASDPEELHPLTSQPLLELCLRIPTYVHMDGGRDRGLARRAFLRDVPAEVLARTWKGRPGSLAKSVVLGNAGVARELLLDGELAKHGVLDRRQVEEALSTGPTRNASPMSEIFDHAITEAWCRIWVASKKRSDDVPTLRAAV